jgi:hypothetical protein
MLFDFSCDGLKLGLAAARSGQDLFTLQAFHFGRGMSEDDLFILAIQTLDLQEP